MENAKRMDLQEFEVAVETTNVVESKLRAEVAPLLLAVEDSPELTALVHKLLGRLLLAHHALGAASEAGEVAGKIKKLIRDQPLDESIVSRPDLSEAVVAEAGDTLWYLTALLHTMDHHLDEATAHNAAKLASRAQRGVLAGSGDNR